MRRHTASILSAAALTVGGLWSPASLAVTILVSGNITTSEHWTANNEYVLQNVIYVTNGATLTIDAGTTVRGEPESSAGAHDPGTLVITRGSKIFALGTAQQPIVFTDLNDDNIGASAGTPPYDTKENALSLSAQWGGIVLLGRGYVANNTSGGVDPAREFQIEGLTAAGSLGFYGGCSLSLPGPYGRNCDDDDSGSISFVSARYGGYNLAANNEINGLSLGAVGRSTDIDHIEIFQSKDDNYELWGGAVGLKYIVGANNGDDGLDYDEGWRGKAQFVFMMQGTPGADKSDKGGEHDGGNNPDSSQPMSIPTIYNATYVGLGQKAYTDRAKNTALHFRDNAGGRYYNSFFADFGGAPLCIEGGNTGGSGTGPATSGERSITAYAADGVYYLGPPSSFQLELRDDAFWCFGNGGTVPVGDATANGCDAGKIHYDNGVFSDGSLGNSYSACATPLPIRNLTRFAIPVGTAPDVVSTIDPRPMPGSALASSPRTAPADGFFTPVAYKGAFNSGDNWAAEGRWTVLSRLGYFPECDLVDAPNAVPEEVRGLRFASKTSMTWNPLAFNVDTYDVLRLTILTPGNGVWPEFASATCVETDDADTSAADATAPAAGGRYYYVVRGGNLCGEGTIGFRSSGLERSATCCP